MSDKTPEGSNILPFKRVAKPAPPKESALPELRELLSVYDQLIGLLRETDDDSLHALTDNLVKLVVHCREAMKDGTSNDALWEQVKELRKELREMPQTLRSLLPGIGPRLGESIQQKLGIQFSKYQ